MITNKTLRETLKPVFIPFVDRHIARLRSLQGITDKAKVEEIERIARNSFWSTEEVRILLQEGFSIFVGDKFLSKCKYAAAFRSEYSLTASSKEDRWDKVILYSGDIPDSVLDRVEEIDQLRVHDHYRTYTGGLGTRELFEDLEYLVVSTSPLPVVKFKSVDPFLLVFRREKDSYPMIEVSEKGRIKEIRQRVGEYGFLIVGMWNMDQEVFAKGRNDTAIL